MIFRSRRKKNSAAPVATIEREAGDGLLPADDFKSIEGLFGEIQRLSLLNRENRDPELERRILRLRHWAGARMLSEPALDPQLVEAGGKLPSTNGTGLPEVDAQDLTAQLLRAGIEQNGCLLVRGLVDRSQAMRLADDIDRSFEARISQQQGGEAPAALYEEFEPDAPFEMLGERGWIQEGGGVLAADSPKLAFDMLDTFERIGLRQVLTDYLGERPAISAQKCTLRKAEPQVTGAWHQDGKFLGDVRAMNVWLSLSRCGDEAPGLDLVPRRLEGLVPAGTEGTWLSYQVSDETAAEAAGGVERIIRPIFEPGDVLLFDELFLHQTGSDPEMPKPRYAVESWFFGPSAFPDEYVPLAA